MAALRYANKKHDQGQQLPRDSASPSVQTPKPTLKTSGLQPTGRVLPPKRAVSDAEEERVSAFLEQQLRTRPKLEEENKVHQRGSARIR